MNTAESLKEQFGAIHPKLTDVASYYLNQSEDTSTNNAAKGLIPFPIFKVSESNKAPWIVDVRELAKWLDEQQKNYR